MAGVTGFVWLMYIYMRIATGGPCAKPELVQNFEPNKYLGVWYEMRRDTDIWFEEGECVTAQYTLKDNGTVEVANTQYFGYFGGPDEEELAIGGAQINRWAGKLWVYFFAGLGGNYAILDTDYTGYSVVYSCTSYESAGVRLTGDTSWLLVRDQIEEDSVAYTNLMLTVAPIYESKVPDYDPSERMRTT